MEILELLNPGFVFQVSENLVCVWMCTVFNGY